MTKQPTTAADFLRLSDRVRVLPIIHGSGDFAVRVRAELLERPGDCLAVPLPPSFQDDVEEAVQNLPVVSCVVQRDAEAAEGREEGFSFVPIDPCQGVIAAVRLAMGEHVPRAFVDLETPYFEPLTAAFPDPYALKKVSIAGFAAAVLPSIPPPEEGQHTQRIRWMAHRLRELERRYKDVVFVCSLLDWPWVRQAYKQRLDVEEYEPFFSPIQTLPVEPRTLAFFLGEIPFITGLYERGRIDLGDDENLSIDGVKELLLEARERLKKTHPRTAARVTPQLLSIYFRYVRNLSLIGHRLTPDLYTLIVAAQQTAGDDFALAVAEAARAYPYLPEPDEETGSVRMGIDSADVPGWGVGPRANRLPGQSITWGSLKPAPPARAQGSGELAAALEPARAVFLAAGGRPHRELHGPRARSSEGAHRRRPGPLGEVHDERDGRPRRARDGAALAHRRHLRQGDPAQPRHHRGGRLFVRGRAGPEALRLPGDVVRRTPERIDAGVLRDQPAGRDGRPRRGEGGVRRRDVRLAAAADPRRLERPASEPRRHARRAPAGRGVLAQQRAARRGGQPLRAAGGVAAAGAALRAQDRSSAAEALQRPADRAALRTFHVLNGKQVRSYAADFIRET